MKCQANDCKKPARVAVRTSNGVRGTTTTTYYDDRSAPESAVRYCNEHGRALVAALVRDLADVDDD